MPATRAHSRRRSAPPRCCAVRRHRHLPHLPCRSSLALYAYDDDQLPDGGPQRLLHASRPRDCFYSQTASDVMMACSAEMGTFSTEPLRSSAGAWRAIVTGLDDRALSISSTSVRGRTISSPRWNCVAPSGSSTSFPSDRARVVAGHVDPHRLRAAPRVGSGVAVSGDGEWQADEQRPVRAGRPTSARAPPGARAAPSRDSRGGSPRRATRRATDRRTPRTDRDSASGPSPPHGSMRAMKSFGSPPSGWTEASAIATGRRGRQRRIGGIGLPAGAGEIVARERHGARRRAVRDRLRDAEHHVRDAIGRRDGHRRGLDVGAAPAREPRRQDANDPGVLRFVEQLDAVLAERRARRAARSRRAPRSRGQSRCDRGAGRIRGRRSSRRSPAAAANAARSAIRGATARRRRARPRRARASSRWPGPERGSAAALASRSTPARFQESAGDDLQRGGVLVLQGGYGRRRTRSRPRTEPGSAGPPSAARSSSARELGLGPIGQHAELSDSGRRTPQSHRAKEVAREASRPAPGSRGALTAGALAPVRATGPPRQAQRPPL